MTGWGNRWGGDHQLIWQCREPNLELQLEFDVKVPGNGLAFGFTKAPDYGTYEIFLDGKRIGKPQDLYDSGVIRADDVKIDNVKIQSGRHRLTFKCVGKNQLSTSYLLGVDYVQVTGRRPEPLGRDEQPNSAALQERIQWLLRKAFRRDIDAETVAPFVSLAETAIAEGHSPEDAMRNVVAAVIGMPEFFYLYEVGTPSERSSQSRQRINDFELATRLSQFSGAVYRTMNCSIWLRKGAFRIRKFWKFKLIVC